MTALRIDTGVRIDTWVRIDARCTACGVCLWTCPTRALLPAPGRPAVVRERCVGCLECVEVCPRGAVSVVAGAA